MANTLVVPRARRNGYRVSVLNIPDSMQCPQVNHKCEGCCPISDPICRQAFSIWFGAPCNEGKIPLMRAHPGLVPNSIEPLRQDSGCVKCRLGIIQLLVSNGRVRWSRPSTHIGNNLQSFRMQKDLEILYRLAHDGEMSLMPVHY